MQNASSWLIKTGVMNTSFQQKIKKYGPEISLIVINWHAYLWGCHASVTEYPYMENGDVLTSGPYNHNYVFSPNQP